MINVLSRADLEDLPILKRTMHEDRKKVFVDTLQWAIPHDGRQEADEFDNGDAVYLVQADRTGRHLASVRLLSTERPHILGSIFPNLCEGEVPRGPQIKEITRYIASPGSKAAERLLSRNMMARALIEHALQVGITTFTAVCDISFLAQILAAGWKCDPLGLPQSVDGSIVGSFSIQVEPDTINKMISSWRYRKQALASNEDYFQVAA